MKWFILVVGIVVLCFVVALVLGLAGGGLGRNTTTLSHEPLPDEPIQDTDFDDLVFDVGARGYRMSQVDGVVDRLRRELREKDEEIAVLRGDAPAHPAAEPTAAAVEPEPAANRAEPATEAAQPSGRAEPAEQPAGPAEQPAGPAEQPDPAQQLGPAEQPDPARSAEPAQAAEPSDPTVGRERTT